MVSIIQDYFECIIKKHEALSDNLPVKIYVINFQTRIKFKIKTGCYLELLIPDTMKLLRSTKRGITEDKNGENLPQL